MIRFLVTNRFLKIYSGIYCSEPFALASKVELAERMPELDWSVEVLGHYVLKRGLFGVDICVPDLSADRMDALLEHKQCPRQAHEQFRAALES